MKLINELIREKYEATRKSYASKYGRIDLPQNSSGLSNKERAFLDLALKMADTSEVDNQHGAVAVKNGRVLALGVNKWRNKGLYQPIDEAYQPVLTVHAEIDALSRIADAEGIVLYIARSGSNGDPRFSRPCPRCMREIVKRGVKRVIYTVD